MNIEKLFESAGVAVILFATIMLIAACIGLCGWLLYAWAVVHLLSFLLVGGSLSLLTYLIYTEAKWFDDIMNRIFKGFK